MSTCKGSSFPRTRGDVPRAPTPQKRCLRFPPHTRGCTPVDITVENLCIVSPAHAGMYRSKGLLAWRWSRFPRTRDVPHLRNKDLWDKGFPRTRGDVPIDVPGFSCLERFPPHTRGCTRFASSICSFVQVSPAHAGMYRWCTNAWSLLAGFPRTRGDVPQLGFITSCTSVFPPHTRGCTVRQAIIDERSSVSPAHAGMYPTTTSTTPEPSGFPRIRRGCALSS